MAKALLGYVGGPDPRLVTEVRRLQRRVVDLEAEVLRLRAENDSLLEMVDTSVSIKSVTLDEVTPAEPVLA
jgi:ABC-type phosphate transport system auxiliary subunit